MRTVGRAARAVAVLMLLTATVACGSTGEPAAREAAYEARLDDGAAVTAVSLRGAPALLSTWATWCAECKGELPGLETLWRGRRDEGLQVVAVNVDGHGIDRGVKAMIRDFGLTMPVWRDPDNNFAASFSTVGVPTTVLLDAGGRVVRTWFGPTDFEGSDVAGEVDAALTTGPTSR
ncbi:MAG: TlpA family protein disulfide reductase [Thermoleophilia bacterium]|nr:TlpA family protein disulfide reductase [Thermoleophilia bacterium]